MIAVWTGAQSGIDMGAALEALDMGFPIGGFMPADQRNEDGDIPERVALHLQRHTSTNPAARTRANVATADAALVIVRDRRRAGETRGTSLTIGLLERRGWHHDIRLLVADPSWSEFTVATWSRTLLSRWGEWGRRLPVRLLVAGPRRSLWPDGESEARRFTRAILEAGRG